MTGLLPAKRWEGISQLLEKRVVLGVSGPAWDGQTQLPLGGGAGDLGVPHPSIFPYELSGRVSPSAPRPLGPGLYSQQSVQNPLHPKLVVQEYYPPVLL